MTTTPNTHPADPNTTIRAALTTAGVTDLDSLAVAPKSSVAHALAGSFDTICACCDLPTFATANLDALATAAVLTTLAFRRANLSGNAAVLDTVFTRDEATVRTMAG